MNYTLEYAKGVFKELEKIPHKDKKNIFFKLEELSKNPKQRDTKTLKGKHEGWTRLRLGKYRVIYKIDPATNTIFISRIAHRKDVYS